MVRAPDELMQYPLNMANGIGYAVANTAAEHQSLSDAGYLPKYAAPQDPPDPSLSPASPAPVGAAPAEPAPETAKKRGRPRKDAS